MVECTSEVEPDASPSEEAEGSQVDDFEPVDAVAEGSIDPEIHKQSKLDTGKDEYNAGNFQAAVKAWQQSLQSVKYILDKGLYDKKPDQLREVHEMEYKLNVKMAQGHFKLGEWCKTVEFADKALTRDPQNTKALYHKAKSQMHLLDFEEAARTWQALLKVEPDSATARVSLSEAKRKAQVGAMKAKKMSQKIFSELAGDGDPRVQLTGRESLFKAARSLPTEAAMWLLDFRQMAYDIYADLLSRARRYWRAWGGSFGQKLEAFLRLRLAAFVQRKKGC